MSKCLPYSIYTITYVSYQQRSKCKSCSYIYPAVCATVWSVCGFVAVLCHKICDSLFPSSDAGTRDVVCVCWADVFMLLATLVRRDSSAAYPSVSAALGRRWRTFAGTQILCPLLCVRVYVCLCVCVCVCLCVFKWVKVIINCCGWGCRIPSVIIYYGSFLTIYKR